MAPRAVAASLTCRADLTVSAGSGSITLRGDGHAFTAETDDFAAFCRGTGLKRFAALRALRRLATVLASVGLRIDVRSRGRLLVSVGRDVRRNLLARAFLMPNASLHPAALFAF